MEKNILKILLTIVGVMVLATPALAATTVSFSSTSVSVKPGQSFNLTINIDPQAVKNYTVKVELRFPADLLEIKSFTFGASGWMAWNQPGYDLNDNTNGILIKTAGYPGGFSSSTNFGTVSFSAKKAGNGVIKLGSDSTALNGNSQNTISGVPEVAFVVNAPAPVIPPKKPVIEAPATTPSEEVTVPTSTQPAEQPAEEPVEQQPIAQQPAPAPQTSFLAAIGNVLALGTGNMWLGILMGLIILAIVVYVIYSIIKKRRKNLEKI